MNYVFSDNQSFYRLWENFVNEQLNASWLYKPKIMKSLLYYSKKNLINDLSFIIVENNMPICICPLLLLSNENSNCFIRTGWNGYLPAPLLSAFLNPKFKIKLQKKCFEKIDELAKQYKVKKIMLLVDPLSESNSFNYLMKYGYIDSSVNTSFVDLTLNEEVLWSSLRNSFKSLINNGKKKFDVVIMDKENADFRIHELYRELHHKAAGRVTRVKETWDLQFDMLKDDNAILIGLKDGNRFVAFSYFFHHNGTSYYGSSSDDPDYETDIPLEHTIIWTAIVYYKNRGFKY